MPLDELAPKITLRVPIQKGNGRKGNAAAEDRAEGAKVAVSPAVHGPLEP